MKIHKYGIPGVSVCGYSYVHISTNDDDVTCKSCIRIQATRNRNELIRELNGTQEVVVQFDMKSIETVNKAIAEYVKAHSS